MAKHLNVNLGFTADTSQAKKQIQDLQNQLTKLINGQSGYKGLNLGIDEELRNASVAAATLQQNLTSAMNVNTGKLDLGKFTQQMNASGMSMEKYKDALISLGPAGAQAFSSLAQSIMTAEIPLKRSNAMLEEFTTTLKNTARWQFSSSIMHGFMGAVQSAYGYAQDLNESLNSIRIVTGQSVEEMERFAVKANKAAQALSISTTAYTDAALIFYQQGLSGAEVEERAAVTAKMAQAAGENATQVSSYMTAIWNNFDNGSKSLEYYGDVMAELGAKTAASSAEIAAGLEKFASIGETVGLSYEYATAAVATVVDKTRASADTVGTAFKTIFARLQGLNLGETLEDGVDLNKYSKALRSVGIEVLDLNGNLKEADVIIDELGDTWSTLNAAQQTALAQTVAGTRQYAQLMSLMNNFNAFKDNVQSAKMSEGTLQEQADIYAESWQAARDRVKASLQAIYEKLLDDNFFIGFLNVLDKTIDGVSNLIDSLGGLDGVLIGIGTLLTKVFAKDLTNSLNNAIYNVKMLSKSGRAAIEKTRTDAGDQLRGLYSGAATPMGEMTGMAYASQADAQDALIKRANLMSESQRAIAQILLDQHQTLVSNVAEQTKLAEQVERESNGRQRQILANARSIDNGRKDGQNTTQKAAQTFLNLTKQAGAFEAVVMDAFASGPVIEFNKHAKDTEKEQERVKKQIEQVRNQINQLNKVYDSAEAMVEAFGRTGAHAFEMFEQAIKQAGDDPEKVEQAIQELINKIQIFDGQIERFRENKDLGDVISEDDINRFRDVGTQAGLAASRMIDCGTSASTFGERLSRIPDFADKAAASFVQMATSLGTVAMAISSVKGLIDTWNNEDLIFGEKLLTTITTLSMVIPSVVSVLGKQNIAQLSVASSAIAAALGITTETFAIDAAGKVTIAATGATVGFGTALWTVLWPIGLVIAAVALLTAGIMALVNAYNKDSQMAEEATTQAKECQNQFEETTKAVEDFKTSLENFDTAIENIDNLTKGTKAYEEALEDANEKAMELIKVNDLLKNKDWKYNSDGLIEFIKDENGQTALDRKEILLENAARKSEDMMYGSKVAANEANLQNARTDAKREIGSVIDYTAYTEHGTSYTQYRQMSDAEMEGVVEAFRAVEDAAYLEADALKQALIDTELLAPGIIDNLDSIIMRGKDSLLDLASSTNDAREANSAYTKAIMQNIVESEHGNKLKDIATDENGVFNENLYNLAAGALTESIAKRDAERTDDLNSRYEKIDVSDIVNTGDIKDYLNDNNLTEYIKDLTGISGIDSVKNDEELGLTYAQMLLERQGVDANRSSLTYDSASGKGTVRDAEGNVVFEDVSDEVMRRQIAQWAMMEDIKADFEDKYGTDSTTGKDAIASLDKLVAGGSAYGEKFGVDFTGAILSSIGSGNFENIDFSNIFNAIDPNEMKTLEGLDSTELLTALGLSEQDIENLGYDSAADFSDAFQSGLEDYDPMSYWDNQLKEAQQGQMDAKSLLEGLESGEELTDEQLDSLERLKAKYEELANVKELSQHEYLELVRQIQEEEEDAAREALEERRELLQEKLDEFNEKIELGIEIDTAEYDELLEEINNTDHSIKLQIETDLASDVEQAFGLADEIQALQEYVGESLKITYDEAQEIIAAGYGAMLQNAQETADGTIQLNKEVVNAFIDGKQSELEADKDSKIQQLKGQREMLVTQLNTLKAKGEALGKAAEAETETDRNAALAKAMLLEAEYQAQVKAMQAELESDGEQKTEMSANAENLYNALSTMYDIDSQNEQNAAQASDNASKTHQENVVAYYNAMQRAVVAYSNAVAAAASGQAVLDEQPTVDGNVVNGNDTGVSTVQANFEASEAEIRTAIDNLTESLTNAEIDAVIAKMQADNQAQMDAINAQIGSIDAGIAALESAYKSLDKAQESAGSKDEKDSSKDKKEKKNKDSFDIDADNFKKTEDEIDRYHVIKNILESIGYELDEISERKDRAFGKNKIKAINDETAALKKQQAAQEQYISEIENHLKSDKAALGKYGVSFDNDGNISNYNDIVNAQVRKYNDAYLAYISAKNEAVAAYNSSAKEDGDESNYNAAIKNAEARWKAAQNAYDKFKDDIDQYEETVDLFEESKLTLQEIKNELYDLALEKVQYIVELKIDVAEDSLEYLEYLLGKLNDDAYDAAEAMALLGKQAEESMKKIEAYQEGIRGIFENHVENGDIDAGQMEAFLDGDESAIEALSKMSLTEEEVQTLREWRSALLQENETLMELRKEVRDKVIPAFEELTGELDKQIEKIEHLQSVTESYRNIIDIVGKDYLGITNEMMSALNQAQVDMAINNLTSTKAKLNGMKNARAEAQAALEEAISDDNEDLIKFWQDTLEEIDEDIRSAEQDYMTSWEEALQEAARIFEESVSASLEKFTDALAGEMKSLDALQSEFDRQRKAAERYLPEYKQIYELSKLTRDINKANDETDNVKAKQEYKKLLEEINEIEESGREISEYELKQLQAKFELKQAELALEEVRNAKSQVRMTRDNEGNWGYVYTANEDEIDNALQNYEDKLYAINELAYEYAKEQEEALIQLQYEFAEAIQNIQAEVGTDEWYAEVERITTFYTEQNAYHLEQLGLALDDASLKFEDTTFSTLTGFQTMEGYQKAFNDNIGDPTKPGTLLGDINKAYEDWKNNVERAMNAAGTSTDGYAEHMMLATEQAVGDSQTLTEETIYMAEEMCEQFEDIVEGVMDWEQQYGESIDEMISRNEDLIQSLNDLIRKMAEVEAAKNSMNSNGGGSSGGGYGGGPDGSGGPDSSGGSGGGGGGGGLSVGSVVTYTGGTYYYDSYGSTPSGSRGPGKQVTVTDIKDGRPYPIHVVSSDSAYGWLTRGQLSGFDTGGYTGEWGPEGRLALLHQKELVLNAHDTENMLKTIEYIREMNRAIEINAMSFSRGLDSMIQGGGRIHTRDDILQQEVTIHAEFPNVQDRHEIEDAFENLINRASQYANRKI